jgi:hypothetical protein
VKLWEPNEIDRFDLRMDGTYRGFEVFCAPNARRTDEKYLGSYETSVRNFILIALNCALAMATRI